MIITTDTTWPVFTPDPINWYHSLNIGRVIWLMGIPPLDGGSTIWDLCSKYPGTLSGMTTLANNGWRAPTRQGGFSELRYDGTASKVDTAFTGLSGASQATLAMWFRRPATSGIAGMMGCTTDGTHAFQITAFTDAGIYCSFGANNGRFNSNDTNWHRAMYVYDGTQTGNANRLQFYLDGVPQTVTFTGTIPATAPTISQTFQLGRDPFNSRWTTGFIDDATVWLRPLSAREAFMDYELSKTGYPGVLNRIRPTPILPHISFLSVWSMKQSQVIGSGVF